MLARGSFKQRQGKCNTQTYRAAWKYAEQEQESINETLRKDNVTFEAGILRPTWYGQTAGYRRLCWQYSSNGADQRHLQLCTGSICNAGYGVSDIPFNIVITGSVKPGVYICRHVRRRPDRTKSSYASWRRRTGGYICCYRCNVSIPASGNAT